MAAALLLLGALCMPRCCPHGYIDRLSTITDIDRGRDRLGAGPLEDAKVAAGIVAKHPDRRRRHRPGHPGDERGARHRHVAPVHNAYLQYAVDLGLPGLLLFAWLHMTLLPHRPRGRTARGGNAGAARSRAARRRLQMSLVAFFVAAMFHPIAYQFYFFSIGRPRGGAAQHWYADGCAGAGTRA